MTTRSFLFSVLFFALTPVFLSAEETNISFKNANAELILSPSGTVAQFIGADGTQLMKSEKAVPFAELRITKGRRIPSTSIQRKSDGTLTVRFGENPAAARFRIETADTFISVEVLGVDGGEWYGLDFAVIPLAETNADGYGVTAVSMAPGSIPVSMPGMPTLPGGKTYAATIADGAKIALVTAPKPELRQALQAAVSAIPSGTMPISPAGGPWAADVEKNRGNYIIHAEPLPLNDASRWIEHLKKYGVNQLDFHQGRTFRQGDFVYNPEAWPNGTPEFRQLTDLLRAEGILSGLHTYSEFIDPHSKYITPIPHPDLDVLRSFTLTEDLDAETQELTVDESTADVSTEVGFMEKNSLYLRIDNELIKFGTPSKEAPYRFTECERGALGTTAAPHKAGSKVDHLTHVYSLFAPKPGSELFYEIARETARAYNEGGYSMIYLDALDGTAWIVDDGELVWYYDTKFVSEILRNCTEPPLIEYSTMDSNIWMARSRMGAWDAPYRGFREFYRRHFTKNRETADAAFLPGQIGWLSLAPPLGEKVPGYQKKPLFAEDIHYLGSRLLAYDYGYSLLDAYIDGAAPAAEANGAILKRYARLRGSGTVDPELLKSLKETDDDVILVDDGGKDRVVPVTYTSFPIEKAETDIEWNGGDPAQLPYIRIENRYAVDTESAGRIPLLERGERRSACSGITVKFDPPIDLSNAMGIAAELRGNGAKKLNVQLHSPHYLVSGHADHFAEFQGEDWQTFTFAESQSGTADCLEDWKAGDCRNLYSEFREPIHYEAVSEVRVMTVPPSENLEIRSLDAVPLRSYSLVNPSFEIEGTTLRFEGAIPSGSYLEYDPQTDASAARILTPLGEELARVPVNTGAFRLPAESGTVKFRTETDEKNVRASVTFRTLR